MITTNIMWFDEQKACKFILEQPEQNQANKITHKFIIMTIKEHENDNNNKNKFEPILVYLPVPFFVLFCMLVITRLPVKVYVSPASIRISRIPIDFSFRSHCFVTLRSVLSKSIFTFSSRWHSLQKSRYETTKQKTK